MYGVVRAALTTTRRTTYHAISFSTYISESTRCGSRWRVSSDVVICYTTTTRNETKRERRAHLTKYINVPISWFRLRPYADQLKIWEQQYRERERRRELRRERAARAGPSRRERAARPRRRIWIVSCVVFALTMKNERTPRRAPRRAHRLASESCLPNCCFVVAESFS